MAPAPLGGVVSDIAQLIRECGRRLAREAYVQATGDVDQCPSRPTQAHALERKLDRAPTLDELRELVHAYRGELHHLNALNERALRNLARPTP